VTPFFQINRDVSLQSFLAKNKVFSEVVQYEFEPSKHDKVSLLSCFLKKLKKLEISVLIKRGPVARGLLWQHETGVILFLFFMYISGAKFEEH